MSGLVPDQPDGISDDSSDLPESARAAFRVHKFLESYGDGLVYMDEDMVLPPLYARDLQVLANLGTGSAE